MNNVATKVSKSIAGQPSKVRSYHEVVEYLDALPACEYGPAAVSRMAKLNELFGNVAHKVNTVLVGGTNGKSLAINFAVKLFNEENVASCALYSTHFLTYNERISFNGEAIPNKPFADVMNQVINEVEVAGIPATAHELVLLGGFLYGVENKSEVVLVEVSLGGKNDVSAICNPCMTVVTRVADDATKTLGDTEDVIAAELVSIARPGVYFVSAEQSKIRLQRMKVLVEEAGAKWAMPIRKLAPLPYIYEQLYGRTASLGERITQLYVEEILNRFSPFLRGNLLATQEGQRGRPTLEAKRNAEMNPIKSMKNFWKNQFSLLRGRFEVLDKEKPMVVLDNASNVDALTNVFLGARLLHYQRVLKGFVLIMGASKALDVDDLLKAIRYLLKKVPGEVIFIPLERVSYESYKPEELAALAAELNIRVRAAQSFEEAFALAKELVDPREGLIAVTGSPAVVSEYWQLREVKKL